jgi:fructose-1,6-bisphosphatase-3
METLQDGYGINLLPLATLAMDVYGDDPCTEFMPRLDEKTHFSPKEVIQLSKMHKAISIIQFKLEGGIIDRHPEWKMDDRKLLHHIDREKGVLVLDGKEYEMCDTDFPTVDPEHPYDLTAEEMDVMNNLHHSFVMRDRLKKHIRCLLSHGCIYNIYNSNLLFHASVPLNEDGTLKEVLVEGGTHHPRGFQLRHRYGRADVRRRLLLVSVVRARLTAVRQVEDGYLRTLFPEGQVHLERGERQLLQAARQ